MSTTTLQTRSAARKGVDVVVDGASKTYGSARALGTCSLTVPAGSFATILGPSGSGKTTLLNLIAGFTAPDQGEIYFGGRPVSGLLPHQRGIGMVFQSYALFPHMSVRENIAFPLRRQRGLAARDITQRVDRMLGLVRLDAFADRKPAALSGGQRQRVAMARALASQPAILLLDEPLSALDKSLREHLQVEIKALHREFGSTFICVTHDQDEAMAMSDLVVVMNEGGIEQIAPPRTLYQLPETPFVARFMGSANLLQGTVTGRGNAGDEVEVHTASGMVLRGRAHRPCRAGDAVHVVFRPEHLRLLPAGAAERDNQLRVQLQDASFLGDCVRIHATHVGQAVTATLRVEDCHGLQPGQELVLGWSSAQTRLLGAAA